MAKLSPELDPAPAIVGRFGTFMLYLPKERDPDELTTDLVHALEKDARVQSVHRSPRDALMDKFFRMYRFGDLSRDDLLASKVGYVLRLIDPLLFEVRVPRKNQRTFYNDDYVPAEQYAVRWNGTSVCVFWEADPGKPVPMAGGHIVEEILEQATRRVGALLLVQACTPGCNYRLAHTTMRVIHRSGLKQLVVERDPDDTLVVNLHLPVDQWVPDQIATMTFGYLAQTLHRFALMKNRGHRMIDLEDETRRTLDELLNLQYEQTRSRPARLRKSWRKRWESLRSRRRSRELLAQLWMLLARMETLQRRWWYFRRSFDRGAANDELTLLFATEHDQDTPVVESLDLGLLEKQLEQLSARLDVRRLVLATAGGAVSGAIVGALIVSALASA